jgi:hypothetical protein
MVLCLSNLFCQLASCDQPASKFKATIIYKFQILAFFSKDSTQFTQTTYFCLSETSFALNLNIFFVIHVILLRITNNTITPGESIGREDHNSIT